MFAYEQEVRIVRSVEDGSGPDQPGFALDWNPENNAEAIFVHPEADISFFETVVSIAQQFAPALRDRVAWSAMRSPPPF
jgi:hypothetical protein